MSTNVTLGERLVELRNKRGLKQNELAEQLEITRVSLSNYERGERRPDSDIIRKMCEKLDVSADYLLGITNTEKQEYAKISETTGLDEESIEQLHTIRNLQDILNLLLHEEPRIIKYDSFDLSHLDDPAYIEQQYEEHLKFETWEKENRGIPILEHAKNDWKYAEYCNHEYDCPVDEDRLRLEHEEFEKEMKEKENAGFFKDEYIPTLEEQKENEIRLMKQIEEEQEREKVEKKKSNLLSAIIEYVTYQSGCSLETSVRSEELTPEHSLYLGTGNGKSIRFPSKESDELFDFMLIQNVIAALKKLKNNLYKIEE